MHESKRRAQQADGLTAAFSLTQSLGKLVDLQTLGAQDKITPRSTKSFEGHMQVMRQGGIGEPGTWRIEHEHGEAYRVGEHVRCKTRQHRSVINSKACLVVLAAFLRVSRATRHPHSFSLLGGYTAEWQLFEGPYRHRRNLLPVLYSLGRLPASLTVFVIGNIGVILIRKETQCQRVKGIIVQCLLHPPV